MRKTEGGDIHVDPQSGIAIQACTKERYMTPTPDAGTLVETPYAKALRLARETVERDDRDNAAPSRILRPGVTSEYQLAKALLSADNLLEREGINHDGTRKRDAEMDRILSMTDEEVRASLIAEGIDPDLAAQNTKYGINQVIQLVQLRARAEKAEAALASSQKEVAELREDAERYRHLRANITVKDRMFGYCTREWTYQGPCDISTLDAAIDAAISVGKER